MKKDQSSQRKLSKNVDISQPRISSFFAAVPKVNLSNNNITLDVESSSGFQSSVNKKRKERNDDTFEKDLHTNIKKKYTQDDICITKPASKMNKDSGLATKNLKDACNNFKDNKVLCENIQSKDINKKKPNTILRMKSNIVTSKFVVSSENTNISKDDNSHILKESQNLNAIVLESSLSPAKTYNKTKLHNSESIESFDDLFTVDEKEFNDCFNQEWHMEAQINFTTLQRCKIIDVKYDSIVTTLIVQHVDSEAVDTVVCLGFWKDTRMKIDDVVMIQAKKESQQWTIDNNNGFLITQPDTLISSTTITSGLFCNRRAVLSEKFRKIESLPDLNADYSVMTVGSLVHQWMQKALCENVHALSDVIKLLDDILHSKSTIEYLYASELSLTDCRKRMMEYAPRIFEFIQHYIKGNKQQHITNLKNNFSGNIHKIQDIEENVCIPRLGMKGRIDVTAEVKINSRRKIMPLEVKTGRASFSLEHKGQIILYLMMMGFRDQEIDSGLLLYLKENIIQEIKGSHHEKRDLMLLRNTLAYYFTKQMKDFQNTASELDANVLKEMELPEPINHHSACARCPYQTLCCVYLTKDPNANLAPSHPLTALIKGMLDNLESSHLDYVMKWIAFLQLEENFEASTNARNNNLSNLWTISPEKRETKGTCLCNLKLVGKVVEQNDRYQHTFSRDNIKEESIENNTFRDTFAEKDYIIISTDERVNIAAGYIMHVFNDTIAVLLDKDVTRGENIHCMFHIDKYPFVGSLFAFNYANVAGLLNNDETSAKLRRIVIDKKPATFTKKLSRSVVTANVEMTNRLNENQWEAVLQAMAADEYILIKGMPGTGKTQTLVALIELLLKQGSTVLITAHTHNAVDNVLLKLLDRNIDFLRLGTTKQIHPLLTCKSEEYATRCCDTPESLEELYNGKRVVGVTCCGAYHPLLRRRTFDICVVDESAQIMQPTVLRPLYSARRFVLVGDPDQLPPVIRNRTAIKLGADESLFIRLDSDNNTVNLTKQYRMNGRIMKLANDISYHGKLITGNKQVENATLAISSLEIFSSHEKWIRRALSRHLDDSVVVLNTGNTYNLSISESHDGIIKSDKIYSNIWEAAIVLRLVRVLMDVGVHARNIGIIAPYNAHVTLLKRIVGEKEVEVNTVDQYQGRDKDVILYSCARSIERATNKEFEILDDQRRLTVAITRAKHKLIVIANKVILTKYAPFKSLFDVIDEKNMIDLHDDKEEFNWKDLVRSIMDNINCDS